MLIAVNFDGWAYALSMSYVNRCFYWLKRHEFHHLLSSQVMPLHCD